MVPTTVWQAIRHGEAALPRRPGLPEPRREARWLLAHAWGRDESWVRLHMDAEVPAEVHERYVSWVERRAEGEPAHHMTGECPFWGRQLAVGPSVLIPRPETELLVQAVLDLPVPDPAAVVDVGTGSGCLAVTLAAERCRWRVWAVDVSLPALEVARHNARRHRVAVGLWAGDLLSGVPGRFDLVVANLPYVPTAGMTALPVEVQHDPTLALDGGDDGLVLVRRLLGQATKLLAAGGWLVLELGEGQADAVVEAALGLGLEEHHRVRDLGGCERVVVLGKRAKG